MFDSNEISEWMDYIQTLHAREIELSLERVSSVFRRLCPQGVPFTVVSVAGTNGKGSTTELVASIYRQAGFKAGKFTSPHLVSFNERFNVDGGDVSDAQLIAAFRQVERARHDTPITYFEYGLLLAVTLFCVEKVDIAIMEVGLGGRLDAVNILDADVAIITSIALDHTAWLGDTLEQIAYEKSCIARPGRPCIVGVHDPQQSLMTHLATIDAEALYIGKDFSCVDRKQAGWSFESESISLETLPLPFEQNGVQVNNAALAVKAVECLQTVHPVSHEAIRGGIRHASLNGRCQILSRRPYVVLDVSHNEASLQRLREFIQELSFSGRLVAVCGMLKDKEITASLAQLADVVDDWHFATINQERGADADHLSACLSEIRPALSSDSAHVYDHVEHAYFAAIETLTADDCLVVFGSFYIAGDIINLLETAA